MFKKHSSFHTQEKDFAKEILHYLHPDFYNEDEELPLSKRSNHEYYHDYDANDMREKGMVPVIGHKAYYDSQGYQPQGYESQSNEGLSRNRNREFQAMNQQLQHFPRKRPPHHPQTQDAPVQQNQGNHQSSDMKNTVQNPQLQPTSCEC